MPLSHSEQLRYSRHLSLPQVGVDGQEKLKAGSVLVIGAGGLGSPASMYLAAAGVGRIGIVEHDVVDVTNLQRQILYGTSDVGVPKLDRAVDRLRDINDTIEVVAHRVALTSQNALEILREYDVVVDATDNFPTRYLVNDACVLLRKPDVYGSIFRFEGQVSVFDGTRGPCYRCLYPEPPPPGVAPSCEEGGVLGVLPGTVGTIQATEALKLLLGIGAPLIGRLLLFDALDTRFRELRLKKNPACSICGENPSITKLIDYERFCSMPLFGTRNEESEDITPVQLAERLAQGDKLRLIDVREPLEWDMGHLEGAELIPLGQVPASTGRLSPDEEIIVYCRSGARSGRAKQILQQAGFERVRNMLGGFERWKREVGK